jgi:hypothetical protein
MDRTRLTITLHDQNRWPLEIVRVLLDHDRRVDAGEQIVEKNIIGRKLSKAVPRKAYFALPDERLYSGKDVAHGSFGW